MSEHREQGNSIYQSEESPPVIDESTYRDERKLIIDARRESVRSFDKTMLTLSGAALALSLGFISDVVDSMERSALLITAWCFFSVAVVCTLVSFLTSRYAFDYRLESLNAMLRLEPVPKDHWSVKWTDRLNFAAIALFLIGMALLLWFTSINLPE